MLDFIRKQDYWNAMDLGLDKEIPGKLSFQLKTMQDLWAYSVIRNEKNKKIAEIGGGESRILPRLALANDCYNIEKFEGADHGPESEVEVAGVTNIKGFVGEFSPLVRDDCFDCVFSVSVVEHVETDDLALFFEDCARILKPGGMMVHAIDMYLADTPADYFLKRWDRYKEVMSNDIFRAADDVFDGAISFSTSMVSNPDQIMYGWKRLSPDLDGIRQSSQSVSVKMHAIKL